MNKKRKEERPIMLSNVLFNHCTRLGASKFYPFKFSSWSKKLCLKATNNWPQTLI